MNETANEFLINFMRNVWRNCFPEHKQAPITLCYDPLSILHGSIDSGLCHIAHDAIYMFSHDDSYDPDSHIYSIDDIYNKDSSILHQFTTADISSLPEFECVLFVSNDFSLSKEGKSNAEIILDKIRSQGVIVVVNEWVEVPKTWMQRSIAMEPLFEITTSSRNIDSQPIEIIKNIKVFLKP